MNDLPVKIYIKKRLINNFRNSYSSSVVDRTENTEISVIIEKKSETKIMKITYSVQFILTEFTQIKVLKIYFKKTLTTALTISSSFSFMDYLDVLIQISFAFINIGTLITLVDFDWLWVG